MKRIHPILASYIPVVEGLARTMGEHCEVVLHDLTDVTSSIIAIHNSHISGRPLGAPVTNLGLQFLRRKDNSDRFELNYRNHLIKDKTIKSSSIYIKDEFETIIGCLCINQDITPLVFAESVLKDITSFEEQGEEKNIENFSHSITDLMNQIIEDCTKKVGKPIPLMTKDEKIGFIGMLDENGLFLIKGAIQQVAALLDVTKYTIYNYLEKASNNELS